MADLLPRRVFRKGIYKDGLSFDFYAYTAEVLLPLADRRGFIRSHEVKRYLGRRYCLPKKEIKKLLRTMQMLGYLQLCKRGLMLECFAESYPVGIIVSHGSESAVREFRKGGE